MTGPPALLWLPLLLPLLTHYWVPTVAGDRKVVVLTQSEVHGSLGDSVDLPCILQYLESEIPRVKQIKWKRLKSWGNPSTVAEFHWERGPNIPDPDHVQFVVAGEDLDLLDASLTFSKLRPDDEANYTCEITTFQQGSGRASTWLRVFYAPQVFISVYDDTGQHGHGETSLRCDASGNPEPRSYEWSTTTGPLPPSAVPHGPWLLLKPSEETNNITFTCRVSNTLGTAQAAMNILLPGSSRKQSQSFSAFWIVLLIVALVVIVVLVVLINGYFFRKSRVSSPEQVTGQLVPLDPRSPPEPRGQDQNRALSTQCLQDSTNSERHTILTEIMMQTDISMVDGNLRRTDMKTVKRTVMVPNACSVIETKEENEVENEAVFQEYVRIEANENSERLHQVSLYPAP